jgi:RNA polymerase sigma-70 factor (ECF subfamily)
LNPNQSAVRKIRNLQGIPLRDDYLGVGQIGAEVDRTETQDEIYQRAAQEYGAALARMAYAYEADPDLRRDLSQEMHLALWRSLGRFNGRCSLRTWIYRVAHNVAASHVVRQARAKRIISAFLTLEEAETQAGDGDMEISADRNQALDRLFALIQRLDPLDRQVMMAYLEDLDAASIAEITGLSTENVWSKIHRIKNVLMRRFPRGGRNAL